MENYIGDQKHFRGTYNGYKLWQIGQIIGHNWYGKFYATQLRKVNWVKVKGSEKASLEELKAFLDRKMEDDLIRTRFDLIDGKERHKITIKYNPKPKQIDENIAIGGMEEPINLVFYLKDFEYNNLCSIYNSLGKDVSRALYTFTHQGHCTPHHRYRIWKECRIIPNGCEIEGLE
jgi:hypothetical protein